MTPGETSTPARSVATRRFGLRGVRLLLSIGVAFGLGVSGRWLVGPRADRVIDLALTRFAPAAPLDPGRAAIREHAALLATAIDEPERTRVRVATLAWIARYPSSWCAVDLAMARAADDAAAGELERAVALIHDAFAKATSAARARGLAFAAGLARERGARARARDLSVAALGLATSDRLRGEVALALGDLEVALGRDDAARAAYGLVVAHSPQPAKRLAAGVAIGWCWLRTHHPDEAAACFAEGLSRAPARDEASWRWGLAHAAHERGDRALARDQLERVAASPVAGELAARARVALAAWSLNDPR